jgi:hypothetical protein
MSRNNDPVRLYVEDVLAESEGELSLLCVCEGSGEGGAWLPRSELIETEVEGVGDSGYVEIPQWLAEDRELV